MNFFHLSLNLLRRDWRADEWRVLLLALVLAVGSLATVGLFADRVRQALQQQAQSLIGADLRVTSTRAIPSGYREAARARGLQVVESRTFPSMVAHGEDVLLSEIQAVEAGYPLRGKIEIETNCSQVHNQHLPPCRGKDAPAGGRPLLYGAKAPTTHARMGGESGNDSVSTPSLALPLQRGGEVNEGEGATPQRGTVWVDERLLRRLNVAVGDAVGIGAQQFIVAARIVKDIDQSIGFASFAPRVLMNDADLVATGLLQEGSRISYRMMFAGDATQVVALRTALQEKISASEKLEDVRDARPEIRVALERAEHFLGLAALTAAILAGAAIALASRRFVVRHLDACAVMRCLGAQQHAVLRIFLYQFLVLGTLAAVLGAALAYAAQAMLVEGIAAMRAADLPPPGLAPLFKAAVSGYALLVGFAFLPLLQLRSVPPLRVLRRELGAPEAQAWLVYGMAVLALALLFLWHAGSAKLGLAVLLVLLAGLLLSGLTAWLLLQALARYAPAARWRHVFGNLLRHGGALQIVALGLGGMALLALTLVRADLMQSWRGNLPPDAPNRFLVNVQVDQYQPVLDFFAQHALPAPELQPMVRGRLVAINDRVVSGGSYADPAARSLVEREFNLSYMEQMPAWNETVDGRWWRAGDDGQLSVEEGIAKTLGMRLGDTLTYDVAGTGFSARITHLRKVRWDSMKVNFFVIATPTILQDFPASYLTSFHLSADQAATGDALSKQFPSLILIDTDAVIAQVRGIMDQIAQAVSAVFLFTLLSGLAVLYAALLATRDERIRETAILRVLGAERGYLRRLHLAEFAALGGLSGLYAASAAVMMGWALARFVLDIPYHVGAQVWVWGCGGGTIAVMLAGALGIRGMLDRAPLELLRE